LASQQAGAYLGCLAVRPINHLGGKLLFNSMLRSALKAVERASNRPGSIGETEGSGPISHAGNLTFHSA
jgi:hypothetical protein